MIPVFEYAAYVWGSYLVFAVVVGWQIVQPVIRRKRIQRQLAEQYEEMQAAGLTEASNSMEKRT